MKLWVAQNWEDYELLDSGEGRRLERFGKYVLDRPDPGALWRQSLDVSRWSVADARFIDKWNNLTGMPERWEMGWEGLKFYCRLSPFKHTGGFPEQSSQWGWLKEKLLMANGQLPIKILNLFGYTGVASLVCARAGAEVTHVDASRPSITWARENQGASGLENAKIRWIVEDAITFCEREVRRGNKYDGIIADPPAYGHGPNNEVWDAARDLPKLFELMQKLLSPEPRFVLVNAYAVSFSGLMLENMLRDITHGGVIESGELALRQAQGDRLLSTGIFGTWTRNN